MPSLLAKTIDTGLFKAFLVFSVIFALVALVLFIIRKIAFSSFYRWARRTDTRADDIILESIRHPSIYWVLAISLYIALDTSEFPPKYVNYGLGALHVLIILSVTLAVANISSRLVQNAIERSAISIPATGLSMTVIKVLIFAIGVMITLNSIGISITPLLTALGVGGLAVALALQDTLSNLFAGVHILVEKPVKVNDYIKLNTGEEGFVVDIGWRTTRIRELSNNIIIVPNNKLAQSTITNYSLPEKRMAAVLKVSVSYSSDPDRVESILLEEALKASAEVKGIIAEPPPSVRFAPGFGESSLDFTIACQVAEYTDQQTVQHELRKRIFRRLRKEGIDIPFPTRTVHLKQP